MYFDTSEIKKLCHDVASMKSETQKATVKQVVNKKREIN